MSTNDSKAVVRSLRADETHAPSRGEGDASSAVGASTAAPNSDGAQPWWTFRVLAQLRAGSQWVVERFGREYVVTFHPEDWDGAYDAAPSTTDALAAAIGYGPTIDEALDSCDDVVRELLAPEWARGCSDTIHPVACRCHYCDFFGAHTTSISSPDAVREVSP